MERRRHCQPLSGLGRGGGRHRRRRAQVLSFPQRGEAAPLRRGARRAGPRRHERPADRDRASARVPHPHRDALRDPLPARRRRPDPPHPRRVSPRRPVAFPAPRFPRRLQRAGKGNGKSIGKREWDAINERAHARSDPRSLIGCAEGVMVIEGRSSSVSKPGSCAVRTCCRNLVSTVCTPTRPALAASSRCPETQSPTRMASRSSRRASASGSLRRVRDATQPFRDLREPAAARRPSLPTPGTMKRNLADYSLLKSFQFSLLWRTHLSTARMFQVVDLGPHADRIRRMLLDENPGTARQYPCAIGVAYLGTQARPGLVTPPFALKREGRHWYVISFAGFNWIFLVSNDMERHTWRNWCVQEDGALPIYASDILRYDGFRELARDIIVKNLPALVRVGAIKDTETDTP